MSFWPWNWGETPTDKRQRVLPEEIKKQEKKNKLIWEQNIQQRNARITAELKKIKWDHVKAIDEEGKISEIIGKVLSNLAERYNNDTDRSNFRKYIWNAYTTYFSLNNWTPVNSIHEGQEHFIQNFKERMTQIVRYAKLRKQIQNFMEYLPGVSYELCLVFLILHGYPSETYKSPDDILRDYNIYRSKFASFQDFYFKPFRKQYEMEYYGDWHRASSEMELEYEPYTGQDMDTMRRQGWRRSGRDKLVADAISDVFLAPTFSAVTGGQKKRTKRSARRSRTPQPKKRATSKQKKSRSKSKSSSRK
jgi:hypothetical protein